MKKNKIFNQWREDQADFFPDNKFIGFYQVEIPPDKILILCSSGIDLTTALNEYIDFRFEEKSQKFRDKLYFDINEIYKLQKDEFNR